MDVSVVIPTCNRKSRLLSLLGNLNGLSCMPLEVIVVDAGEDILTPAEYAGFKNLDIRYLRSEKSVCIQRNAGIRQARAAWIFLCDDDVEVPSGYLQELLLHVDACPAAGAVSGLFLQQEQEGWTAQYPVRSARELVWKFVFQLSIWGAIDCPGNGWLIKKIKQYYRRKGNHISKAGWPVITDFTGPYFTTPVYSLGASLVRKDWLLQSPFDEVLDRHGMGDNYGVALGFPPPGIHIVPGAIVYHHREPLNRLQRPLQYFRRVLALGYFIGRRRSETAKKRWLLWSLAGNLLNFVFVRDYSMIRSAFKSMWVIALAMNPYEKAAKATKKVTEPLL